MFFDTHTHMFFDTHTHARTHARTHTHTHTHTLHTHTHTHAHTLHTHTHTHCGFVMGNIVSVSYKQGSQETVDTALALAQAYANTGREEAEGGTSDMLL